MYCWDCYWGWPKKVWDIYKKALCDGAMERVLHYGPSHIVWEDENWHSAEWCLETFDEWKRDFSEEELGWCRWSLEELVKIPLEERDLCPEDYDEEHPSKYPPPHGTVMVRGGAEYTVFNPKEEE